MSPCSSALPASHGSSCSWCAARGADTRWRAGCCVWKLGCWCPRCSGLTTHPTPFSPICPKLPYFTEFVNYLWTGLWVGIVYTCLLLVRSARRAPVGWPQLACRPSRQRKGGSTHVCECAQGSTVLCWSAGTTCFVRSSLAPAVMLCMPQTPHPLARCRT